MDTQTDRQTHTNARNFAPLVYRNIFQEILISEKKNKNLEKRFYELHILFTFLAFETRKMT